MERAVLERSTVPDVVVELSAATSDLDAATLVDLRARLLGPGPAGATNGERGANIATSRSGENDETPRGAALAIGRTRGAWPEESSTEIDEGRGVEIGRSGAEFDDDVGNCRALEDGALHSGSTSAIEESVKGRAGADPVEPYSPYSSSMRPRNPKNPRNLSFIDISLRFRRFAPC